MNRPEPGSSGKEHLADLKRRELHKRIDRDFVYHPPPNEETAKLYVEIRERARGFGHFLVETVPPSRELSRALSDLEDVVMHANAGIARSGAEEG